MSGVCWRGRPGLCVRPEDADSGLCVGLGDADSGSVCAYVYLLKLFVYAVD